MKFMRGLGIFILIVVAIAYFGNNNSTSNQTPTSSKVSDEQCRTDLQCWGDRNLIAASIYCRDDIERLAKYQAEWTDRWYEQKFSRFRWHNKERGTVTFIGDKVKFQNGFGAWGPVTYSCDFDPATKKVLGVRAFDGRLP